MPKLDLSDIGIDLKKTAKRIKDEVNLLSDDIQVKIKKRSGLSPQQFSNYFGKGENKKEPSMEVIIKMAHVLNKSVDYFLYGEYKDISDDPNCIKIACILPLLNENKKITISGERCFYLNKQCMDNKKLYCMNIEGNMMKPTLRENDLIIIDYSQKRIITEGKIHVFYNKDLPYIQIKRLYFYRDKIMVKPDNKEYSPYLVKFDQIIILGQVVAVFKILD